jgi:hypothetical protein
LSNLVLNMFKKVSLFWVLAMMLLFLQLSAKQVPKAIDTVDAATDTLRKQLLLDTITPTTLRLPDSLTTALVAKEFKKGFGYAKFDFNKLVRNLLSSSLKKTTHQKGEVLFRGELWVIFFVFLFVLVFAVLKNNFSKQLVNLVYSFFNNRVLSNLTKEENSFFSWLFVLLFVLFGFLFGLFTYLGLTFQNVDKHYGFQFFLITSVVIMVLFLAKIFVLYLLGLIFEAQRLVSEYISILYLSYFNAGLLMIPLLIAFCLSPVTYSRYFLVVTIIFILLIFVFQIVWRGINILSNYQLSKVYLFLYFCALEICPILVLIKVIGLRGN